MADFQSSTHRARWIFTPEELAGKYKAANQGAMQALEKVLDVDGTLSYPKPQVNADSRPKPISIEEDQFMRVFYENKLQEVCTNFRFPHKVQATALIYFKRFYLQWSVMQHHPKTIMHGFAAHFFVVFILILIFLFSLLNIIIYMAKYRVECCNHLCFLTSNRYTEVDKIMLTDAPLLFPPGQNFVINHETYPLNLMQQVCRVADFERYLSSILSRQSSAHTISELVEFSVASLIAAQTFAKRYKFPSDKDLKHINRKLKSCWGLSTHDGSKKRDKKSKHKSKRSSNE
ncbi:unnamed protein product [Malus baccata var. baccata]